MRVVIHEAASLTAFEPSTVGTRVLDPEAFLAQVVEAIKREPDSCLLRLPGAEKLVSGRYGWRSQKPTDYVTRLHKGHVHAFLKREFALPVRRVAVAVYPAAAGLVVLGHVALGLWWLRRRARRDDRGREVAEHDANRRRSRTRLPPRSEDGASPS